MIRTFQLGDLVYNRNTKEDGTIRRAYTTNGVAMYKVTVPSSGDSWVDGFNTSDWDADVLQLSSNERLKS
jgi:hypothetical protein